MDNWEEWSLVDQCFSLVGLSNWQEGWMGQRCMGQSILGHCLDLEAAQIFALWDFWHHHPQTCYFNSCLSVCFDMLDIFLWHMIQLTKVLLIATFFRVIRGRFLLIQTLFFPTPWTFKFFSLQMLILYHPSLGAILCTMKHFQHFSI